MAIILHWRIIWLIKIIMTITIQTRLVDLELKILTKLTTTICISYGDIHTLIETKTVSKRIYGISTLIRIVIESKHNNMLLESHICI